MDAPATERLYADLLEQDLIEGPDWAALPAWKKFRWIGAVEGMLHSEAPWQFEED